MTTSRAVVSIAAVLCALVAPGTAGCADEGDKVDAGEGTPAADAERGTSSLSPTVSDAKEGTPRPHSEPGAGSPSRRGSEDPLLNDLENRLIGQMAAIGVDAPGVAELGFKEASVYGGWRGRTAYVGAYEVERAVDAWSGDVVDSIEISDVAADVFELSQGPFPGEEVIRFVRHRIGYQVVSMSGDGDGELGGTSDMESSIELAELLISEFGC